MNLFELNLVPYGDKPGLGRYEVGHFLQHQQYLQLLAAQGINIPDYNLFGMVGGPAGDPRQFLGDNPNQFLTWLNDHEAIHIFLRAQSGVSGIDLSALDTNSPESWDLWQQWHAQEHAQFDQHFGTT